MYHHEIDIVMLGNDNSIIDMLCGAPRQVFWHCYLPSNIYIANYCRMYIFCDIRPAAVYLQRLLTLTVCSCVCILGLINYTSKLDNILISSWGHQKPIPGNFEQILTAEAVHNLGSKQPTNSTGNIFMFDLILIFSSVSPGRGRSINLNIKAAV